MVELSACFFCGTPDDVAPFPVVPRSIAPRDAESDRETVVLCAACADKLERVVDRVVAAVESPDDRKPERGRERNRNKQPPRNPHAADHAPPSDALDPDPRDADRPASSAGSVQSGDSDAAVSTPGSSAEAAASGAPAPSDPTDDGESARSTEGVGGRDDDGAPDDGTAAVDGARPMLVDDVPVDVAPTTVNRVVRLLQNRSFPIDRGDFLEIAAGAYDIDPTEVEAVISMAVDRGLLVERGSTLDRPSEPAESDDTDT